MWKYTTKICFWWIIFSFHCVNPIRSHFPSLSDVYNENVVMFWAFYRRRYVIGIRAQWTRSKHRNDKNQNRRHGRSMTDLRSGACPNSPRLGVKHSGHHEQFQIPENIIQSLFLTLNSNDFCEHSCSAWFFIKKF